jgi:hypothetical protein
MMSIQSEKSLKQFRPLFRPLHRHISMTLVASALVLPTASKAASLFRFEFNEGSGSTVSNTATALTGVLGRAPSFPVSSTESPAGGGSDRSLQIVDPDGFVVLNATNAPALAAVDTPITAEAWVFIPSDAVPRNESIVAYGNSWKFGMLSTGSVGFTLYGVIDADAGVLAPFDTWTHIAAAWEPGVGVTFYLNGVEAGFVEETRAMAAPANSYLAVGGSSALTEPVHASLDRVRVHRALLTAEQLDAVAATPKGPLASTVASFAFNETEAPFVNAGTVGGSAEAAYPLVAALISPQFVTDSPSGKAGDTSLRFDGNDIVRVDDPDQVLTLVTDGVTSDFTIQAWVKPGTQPAGQARSVLFGHFGAAAALSFSISSDRHVAITTYGIVDMISDAVIPNDGLWHHIAAVHRNGVDMRFYVDGILGDTRPYTQGLNVRTETWAWIGSEFGGGLPYVGLLDRLELLNTALEAKDLDSLAVPGVIPEAPELEIGTAVSIAWPSTVTGFTLQSTTDLNPPQTWAPVTAPGTVIGDKVYVVLPTPEQKTFYRLFRAE